MKLKEIVGYFRATVNGTSYDVSYTRTEQPDEQRGLDGGKVLRLVVLDGQTEVMRYEKGKWIIPPPMTRAAKDVLDIAKDRLQ